MYAPGLDAPNKNILNKILHKLQEISLEESMEFDVECRQSDEENTIGVLILWPRKRKVV